MTLPNINLTMTDVPLELALIKAEAEIYKFAIEQSRFNQSRAASALGVSRGTLRTKLNLYFPNVYMDSKEAIEEAT